MKSAEPVGKQNKDEENFSLFLGGWSSRLFMPLRWLV